MKLPKIILILVIILGFICRVVFTNQLPPSLNWDEVSHGYNAYSILKTAKDEWGSTLPLIFRAYGDFKLPLYIYLTVPFVSIFGLNALAVRMVSILSGTILIFAVYLIIKHFLPKKNISPLIGAAIIAFSPITVFLSRIALEANLFLLLFTLSFYFILKNRYTLSSVLYGFCLITYNSSRVLFPIYLIFLITYIFKSKFALKKNLFKFIPFLICISIFLYQTINLSGQARYKLVTIIDQGSINRINELRQYYPRIIVNKYSYFLFTAFTNYIKHFNPKFIFFSGGSNYQFNIPNFYLISPLFLPLFLLGFIFILFEIKVQKQKLPYILLLSWLLFAPLPSAITRDAPHTLRSIVFYPIIVIIISLGAELFYKKFKTIALIFYIFAITFTQINFWTKYINYAQEYSESWQYGYQQIVEYIKDNYSNYDKIIFTKKYAEPHEFLVFFLKWNPDDYQNSSSKKWDYHENWYWVNSFDKFDFINDWEIKDVTSKINSNQKILLITSPNNYNLINSKLITTINFKNGKPAFDILNINENKN